MICAAKQKSNNYQSEVADVSDKDVRHHQVHQARDEVWDGKEVADPDGTETDWRRQQKQRLHFNSSHLDSGRQNQDGKHQSKFQMTPSPGFIVPHVQRQHTSEMFCREKCHRAAVHGGRRRNVRQNECSVAQCGKDDTEQNYERPRISKNGDCVADREFGDDDGNSDGKFDDYDPRGASAGVSDAGDVWEDSHEHAAPTASNAVTQRRKYEKDGMQVKWYDGNRKQETKSSSDQRRYQHYLSVGSVAVAAQQDYREKCRNLQPKKTINKKGVV